MVDSEAKRQYLIAQAQLHLQISQGLSDQKLIQLQLSVLDGLDCYLEVSGKMPMEALFDYYLLLTTVQAFEKPPTKLLRIKARPLHMIHDILNGDPIKRRYCYNTKVCPESFKVELGQYSAWMSTCKRSESTIRTRLGRIKVLFLFLSDKGCHSIEGISIELLIEFIGHLSGKYSSQGKASILYTLRNFFSCPNISLRLSMNPMLVLKGLHSKKHERLGSFYTTDEIKKVMDSVDRNTKSGKTIYVMMLLACVYGLRVSDIRDLDLSSLHWNTQTICLFQHKTKHYIELPLTQNVSFALLDYIKNVRPNIEHPKVFIKHRGTQEPYSINDHFGCNVSVFFKRAGINTNGKHHGLHALRHSLATWLFEADVDIHKVAVILGHSTVAATKSYIWSDIAHLRLAALEVPPYGQ